jgi:hypothetical protein
MEREGQVDCEFTIIFLVIVYWTYARTLPGLGDSFP